ncbi:unnamed protein product [Ectocarpus sp. 6 AP-2014]
MSISQRKRAAQAERAMAGAQPVEQACTEEMAVQSVQSLRSGLLNARKARQELTGQQRDTERAVIDEFRATPYGRKAYRDLHAQGYLIFPVCTPTETEKMKDVFNNFYPKDDKGELNVVKMSRYAAIDSQKRWMIDVSAKGLGDGFAAGAEEATETMAFVLQAMEYGLTDRVDVEKMTVLLSAPGEQNQRLHKDQSGSTVGRRLQGEGPSKVRQSAPYSGLFAFQHQAFLHVIDGSHKDFDKQDGFHWKDAHEITIPPGHAILFHSCLVHAGSTYDVVNGRLHIHFKSSFGSSTADGKFWLVDCAGSPPRARGVQTGGG